MKLGVIDECAAPKKMVPVFAVAKEKVGVSVLYNSIYRGQDAASILHRYGKHTQAELYQMWLNGQGNPANPPGRSTHECRSDGVPYPGPIGRKLRYWQVGFDVNDAYIAATKTAFANLKHHKLGRKFIAVSVEAFQPYPGSSEFHHLNLKKKPIIRLPDLKKGSKGKRVYALTTKLALIPRPSKYGDKGETYFSWSHRTRAFGVGVEKAVKKFQRDHHLQADGIVGPQTSAQIKTSWKHAQNHGQPKTKEPAHHKSEKPSKKSHGKASRKK
jgi:peptidoglycan hydrolase-like protein with peptidoglycan-binding domain